MAITRLSILSTTTNSNKRNCIAYATLRRSADGLLLQNVLVAGTWIQTNTASSGNTNANGMASLLLPDINSKTFRACNITVTSATLAGHVLDLAAPLTTAGPHFPV
jgi:hypothetical protein